MRPVLALALCLGLAAPVGAAGAAEVRVMVVGKQRVLREPATVTLRARSVRASGRRCAAGAATPLSALAGTGLRLRVRDYGSCGRSARDAGGLFVTQVGAERNRGHDGWVYKLGRRTGTAGAADPAGSFGTGRLVRDGERVLWFWCVQDRRQNCQRTLEAVPERTRVAPGAPLRVSVRGYDDFGRGVAAAGATVRLGTAEAVTGADGVATLTAPAAPGRASLVASGASAVRSFPLGLTVG
jgi:hypothetical protein